MLATSGGRANLLERSTVDDCTAVPATKTCAKCGETKALDAFNRSKTCRDGYRGICKTCRAEANRGWYQQNADRHHANGRKWKAENAERYRELARLAAQRRREADPERHAEYSRQWKQANRDKTRTAYLCRTYGLTRDELDRLRAESGGNCQLCGDCPSEGLQVDHCHRTGAVRGLLCRRCNTMLGWANDDIARLTNAIAYVGRWQEKLDGEAEWQEA